MASFPQFSSAHELSKRPMAHSEDGEPESEKAVEGQLKRRRLDVPEDETPGAEGAITSRPGDGPVSVRHLRITVLATRSATCTSMQVAQVALRCNGESLKLEGFTARSPNGQSPLNEGPSKVFQPVGKFLDFNFRAHGQSLLVLSAPRETDVEEIAFQTASDNPSRDPTHVVIDSSVDSGEWVHLLDTGPGLPAPLQRKAWTPWLALRKQGPAREPRTPPVSAGVERFCCTVRPCHSFEAQLEGYLKEGKLLAHMLREHPRSKKTLELCMRLRGAEPSHFRKGWHPPKPPTHVQPAKSTDRRTTTAPQSLDAEGVPSAATLAESGPTVAVGQEGVAGMGTSTGSDKLANAASADGQSPAVQVPPHSGKQGEEEATASTAAASACSGSCGLAPPVAEVNLGQPRPMDSPSTEHGCIQPPDTVGQLHTVCTPQSTGPTDGSACSPPMTPDTRQEHGTDNISPGLPTPPPLSAPHCSSQRSDSVCASSSTTDGKEVLDLIDSELRLQCGRLGKGADATWSQSTLASSAGTSAIPISALDGLQRYPPVEGVVEKRLELQGDGSFEVRLCDHSGTVKVAFCGQAAEEFRDEPALREGGRVRLEGYNLVPALGDSALPACCYELLMSTTRSGARVLALGPVPGPRPVPLPAVAGMAPGHVISVEATVEYVGKLRQAEQQQPGSSVPMRALLLSQGGASCSLVMRGKPAERCGPELLGRRILVQGTRVAELRGKRHLSGGERLELR
mmetsp:Transcript_46257/g.143063  ORF Transcript_46257/g.143063 Transcript_46257/m.143063 type:complete len:739 (+) Transcript_46257:56-2272(+)